MLAGASARRFSVTQTNWGGPDLITDAPRHRWYYAELWESHLDAETLSLLHGKTDLSIVQLRDAVWKSNFMRPTIDAMLSP